MKTGLLIKIISCSHADGECEPCDSTFPRSRVVPNLPGCVLAPLSGKYHQTLLQIFTGDSSESNTWKTWYKVSCIILPCNVHRVYFFLIFSYYVIDRQELRRAQVTQIDIGFYVIPSQTSTKKFTLALGEIKVVHGQSFCNQCLLQFST